MYGVPPKERKMSNPKVVRISEIVLLEAAVKGPSPGEPKTGKRMERIKTKDDVLETGVYFNGPLLRYEAWSVSGDAKKLVGWIGIEACAAQPRCKDYWDKYVWEEYLVIDKITPKDMLEKVLSEDTVQDCKVELARHSPGKVA
jgi:hypothetical protein